MKTRNIQRIITMIIIALMMTGIAQAQQKGEPKGKGICADHQNKPNSRGEQWPFGQYEKIPGITEKQKEDIKAIRSSLTKEVSGIMDQVNEKETRLRALALADKPDNGAIDKLIDEISVLNASKRKKTERARQQVRQMLNKEQKLWFDDQCRMLKPGQTGHKTNQNKNQKDVRGGK